MKAGLGPPGNSLTAAPAEKSPRQWRGTTRTRQSGNTTSRLCLYHLTAAAASAIASAGDLGFEKHKAAGASLA